MRIFSYNRDDAVAYAHKWAYSRNPQFANFDGMGGDCTNFASQCIYAGSKIMNERDWFYHSLNWRSPSWSGVAFLYEFLIGNAGIGPFAEKSTMNKIQKGDIVQLKFSGIEFAHSPVIISVGDPATTDNILVAAHTYDTDYRPLSTYVYSESRFIHILGVRK